MLKKADTVWTEWGIKYPILLITILVALSFGAQAQGLRTITGKITDAETGEVLPYVTVSIRFPNRTSRATTTDFSGIYHLLAPLTLGDSINATYVGYLPMKKLLPKGTAVTVDFQMKTDNHVLNTININPKSYINPAWAIMAEMVKHKGDNNLDNLNSYHFQSYNRLQLSVNNISDAMKKRKIMRQVMPIMDSLQKMAGDDGKPILPVFMSETVSDFYYQRSPELKTEHIDRTRVSGVGIEDETLISQIVGSSFQQYNFYKNYLRLAGKDFISPLSDSWKTFYNYELIDAHDKINGKEYYKIEFKPKRAHDLSFVGVMWLTQDSYALYRMDASVAPDANLDFLSKIRIQQEMIQPEGGTGWIPEKTRIVLQISNINKNWSGFIGNFYVANSNIQVNRTYPRAIFKEPLTMSDSITLKDENYWAQNRPEALTPADKKIYRMIDTVKNLPIVKTYADIAGMLINGYYKVGKFSFGPYLYTYSYNDLQGSVVRIGGITNKYFSDSWVLGGFISYGFNNRKLNYNASVDYIFSHKPWSQAGLSYTHDLNQVGYQFENFIGTSNNVFKASILNGIITRRGPFIQDEFKGYVQTDVWPNWRLKLSGSHRTFDPLFNFAYNSPANNLRYTNYQVSEAIAEVQWTPGRRILQSAKVNKRITLGNGGDNPVITFRYTRGLKVLDGDFSYNKYAANITQKLHMGIFGKGEYSLTGGLIPASIPSSLVENHRYNFNTMRFLEFASDRYISLNYTQHMEGLITNSIPLLKSLNIRTVADVNILDGTLSDSNGGRLSPTTGSTRSLEGVPYVEAGYGVENILKFLRVDFLHRLTQRDHIFDNTKPTNFAIRVSVQFRL